MFQCNQWDSQGAFQHSALVLVLSKITFEILAVDILDWSQNNVLSNLTAAKAAIRNFENENNSLEGCGLCTVLCCIAISWCCWGRPTTHSACCLPLCVTSDPARPASPQHGALANHQSQTGIWVWTKKYKWSVPFIWPVWQVSWPKPDFAMNSY